MMCRAGLGSNTLARARLLGAQAHSNLELGPRGGLRLGSAGLGLKPGLLACGKHPTESEEKNNYNIWVSCI